MFQIKRKEVDSFDNGKRIPACQLQAVAIHEVVDLSHSLKLLGTKHLHDYIMLFRSPTHIHSPGTVCYEYHQNGVLFVSYFARPIKLAEKSHVSLCIVLYTMLM